MYFMDIAIKEAQDTILVHSGPRDFCRLYSTCTTFHMYAKRNTKYLRDAFSAHGIPHFPDGYSDYETLHFFLSNIERLKLIMKIPFIFQVLINNIWNYTDMTVTVGSPLDRYVLWHQVIGIFKSASRVTHTVTEMLGNQCVATYSSPEFDRILSSNRAMEDKDGLGAMREMSRFIPALIHKSIGLEFPCASLNSLLISQRQYAPTSYRSMDKERYDLGVVSAAIINQWPTWREAVLYYYMLHSIQWIAVELRVPCDNTSRGADVPEHSFAHAGCLDQILGSVLNDMCSKIDEVLCVIGMGREEFEKGIDPWNGERYTRMNFELVP